MLHLSNCLPSTLRHRVLLQKRKSGAIGKLMKCKESAKTDFRGIWSSEGWTLSERSPTPLEGVVQMMQNLMNKKKKKKKKKSKRDHSSSSSSSSSSSELEPTQADAESEISSTPPAKDDEIPLAQPDPLPKTKSSKRRAPRTPDRKKKKKKDKS